LIDRLRQMTENQPIQCLSTIHRTTITALHTSTKRNFVSRDETMRCAFRKGCVPQKTGHMRKLREIWVTRQNFSLRRYTTLRTGRRMNRVSNNLAFYLNRLYKLAIIMRRMGNKYKATYSSVFEKVSLFTIMICIRFEKCFKEILFSKPFLGRSRSKESTVHYEIHSSKNVSKKL
jgi:hypothetical protein